MRKMKAIARLQAYVWRLIDRVDAESHRHGDPDELLDELDRLNGVLDELDFVREQIVDYTDESPWAVEAHDRARCQPIYINQGLR